MTKFKDRDARFKCGAVNRIRSPSKYGEFILKALYEYCWILYIELKASFLRSLLKKQTLNCHNRCSVCASSKMSRLKGILLFLNLAVAVAVYPAETFDYIVVGSGPGGGPLA